MIRRRPTRTASSSSTSSLQLMLPSDPETPSTPTPSTPTTTSSSSTTTTTTTSRLKGHPKPVSESSCSSGCTRSVLIGIATLLVYSLFCAYFFFPLSLDEWTALLLKSLPFTIGIRGQQHEQDLDSGAYEPPTEEQEQYHPFTADEDVALELDEKLGLRYHVIFSTDCSAYQQWQSYVVFFTALKVKQTGRVTRIASGCDDEQQVAAQAWFDQHVAIMSRRFHIQFTPKFSEIKDADGNVLGDYKFFNKPRGLKYWLENSPLLKRRTASDNNPDAVEFDDSMNQEIVILIDPDMSLLRPLTADFTRDDETIISKVRLEADHLLARTVGPGKPFAQVYGFGVQWQKLDLRKITNDPNTPARNVRQEQGRLYYPVGPPYLATVPDMYKIATAWSTFVPAVYEAYPHLLAEMFAYCIGAAHVQLPHQVIDSLMISGVTNHGEGWPFIDPIPANQVCRVAKNPHHQHPYPMPTVVHFCQRYFIAKWFFSKRKIDETVFDCDTPLFMEPPDTVLETFTTAKQAAAIGMDPVEAKRHAFIVCHALSIMNQAATFLKQNACPSTGNFQKSYHLVKSNEYS